MSDSNKRAEMAPAKTGAPLWVVPLYVTGMVLVLLGERVVSALDSSSWLLTGPGLAAVVGATVVRFLPQFRAGGERKSIENLLAGFSAAGLAAIGLYFLTTEAGLDSLGLLGSDDEERWKDGLTAVYVALIVASLVPTIVAEVALAPMRRAEQIESRRIRAATAAGLSLALAAVYGTLFVYAAGGLDDAKVDYSYFRTARPSDSTKKIAASINEPVKVTAFFPQVNDVREEVKGYLDELKSSAPNLEVDVQDRLLAPKLARDLRATQDGMVVLEKGSLKETMRIGSDMAKARAKLKKLDGDFQEKLLKVMRSRRVAYLTVGHGELNDKPKGDGKDPRGAKGIKELLRGQNYLVKTLGLTQGLGSQVPDDASIVMVLGPTEPFLPEEVATLKRYADNGGKLLLALDPDAFSPDATPDVPPVPSASGSSAAAEPPKPEAPKPAASSSAAPAPSAPPAPSVAGSAAPPPGPAPTRADAGSLGSLAAVVGLELEPGTLAHETKHLRARFNKSDRKLLFTNSFSSHASVSTLSRNSSRTGIIVIGSGSLVRAKGATDKVTFTVRSVPGTFADANKNFSFDRDSEKKKVYNIAAAVVRKGPDGAKPKAAPKDPKDKKDAKGKPTKDETMPDGMRAFVLADADAFSDLTLTQSMANRLLFVDVVRWLGGEESFAGEVNTEEDVRIEHTKEGDTLWFWSTIFGIPGLVLGLGLFIARRSRRRQGGAA